MDTIKEATSALSAHNFTIHPTHLWIGTSNALLDAAEHMAQQAFCPSACKTCRSCILVSKRQHPSIIWLSTQNQYTKEELEPIFSTIRFSLEPGNSFFFIIDRADHMTASSANSLLKLLEEPPMGYCFLLLAQHRDLVLPTIASRCIINTLTSSSLSYEQSVLYPMLNALELPSGSEFLYALEQSKINEQETVALIDALLTQALIHYKSCSSKKASTRQRTLWQNRISVFCAALKNPLMPAGSKLLLKDIFLQLES